MKCDKCDGSGYYDIPEEPCQKCRPQGYILAQASNPDLLDGETDSGILGKLCQALGWQGGTIHQALGEVRRLRVQGQQATTCAVCGEYKHTPLRRDEMGGYVCLACIDRRLDQFTAPEAKGAQG